jgi:hypothetical protein
VVYHVTSLDDDADAPLPGTFRYGKLKSMVPRTIVFDVGGVIRPQGAPHLQCPFVTVAGQTAPGNGIMIRSCPFGMATEGITRFVRNASWP